MKTREPRQTLERRMPRSRYRVIVTLISLALGGTAWLLIAPKPLAQSVLHQASQESELSTPGPVSTSLLSEIRRVREAAETSRVSSVDCELEDYEQDLVTEYREPSVVKSSAAARLRWRVPRAGLLYLGVIFYDDEDLDWYTLSVDGQVVGRVEADSNDNRQHLHVFGRPLALRVGSVVEVLAEGTGPARLESLLTVPRLPELRQRPSGIRFLKAQVARDEPLRTVVTWVSSRAARSRLEYRESDDSNWGQGISEEEALSNHRLVLKDLKPGAGYRFRVRTPLPDGGESVVEGEPFLAEFPAPVRSRALRQRVELQIKFPDGASSEPLPVTSGVPFPTGALGSPAQVRLVSIQGQEIPAAVRPTSWWKDGSLKWILLDFSASPEQEPIILEYGSEVVRRSTLEEQAVRVLTDGDQTVVQNSTLQLRFDPRSCGLITEVRFDPQGHFPSGTRITHDLGALLVDAEGNQYRAEGPPDELVVERTSPFRSVVRIRGRYRRGNSTLFQYTARVHMFAGAPFVRVLYTFGNDHVNDLFRSIRSLELRVPTTLERTSQTRIGGGDGDASAVAAGDVRLLQDYDNRSRLTVDGRTRLSSDRAPGWMELGDGQRKVLAFVRWFWQLYPKSLATVGNTLSVGLSPALPKGAYTSEADRERKDQLFYYLGGDQYKFKRGVEKTHEIWLAFGESDDTLERWLPLFASSPVAVAPPQWYCASGAFRDVLPHDRVSFPGYEEAVEESLKVHLSNRRQSRAYGMLNFGDWYADRFTERTFMWGNNEYDTAYGFLLQFARTSDRRFFDVGEHTAWHLMDVDTIHHHDDPRQIGGVYAHCIGHVGNYAASDRKASGEEINVSHTWVDGLLTYHFLTGSPRAREMAHRIADRYNLYSTRAYDFTNARSPGWHLILTLAMYDATGDEFYLNTARIIVERVLERREPDGGWVRCLIPMHCVDLPRHRGAAGFMVGILLSGLKRYHQITADPDVERAIVDSARWITDDTWMGDKGVFRYTSCPNTLPTAGGAMLWEGLAYAARLSGDEDLRQVLLTSFRNEATQEFIASRGTGKDISLFLRLSPYVLTDLQAWGENH